MSKGLSYIIFGTLGVFGAIAVNAALKVANTADQLLVDFDDIQIKKITYSGWRPKGVIYTIKIALNNPTGNPLKVSNAFITFSIDASGSQTRIANTPTSNSKELEIKPYKVTILPLEIEIEFFKAAMFLPKFVDYIIQRLRGSNATQRVLATGSIDSKGITIPFSKTLSI